MPQRDREKRLDLVAKLLAKATSVAGTPEEDAFTTHAFALIARLGIAPDYDPTTAGHTPSKVVRHDFAVDGNFLQQRITLLARIARPLHCAHAYWPHSDTNATVAVYGAPHHLDRIDTLYDPLLTRMLRQAIASPWTPSTGLSLRDHQISWMHGFTVSIRARLLAAEEAAAAEADHGTGIHTEQHARDAERAAAAMTRQLPPVRRSPDSPKLELDSVIEGLRAGKGAAPPRTT